MSAGQLGPHGKPSQGLLQSFLPCWGSLVPTCSPWSSLCYSTHAGQLRWWWSWLSWKLSAKTGLSWDALASCHQMALFLPVPQKGEDSPVAALRT